MNIQSLTAFGWNLSRVTALAQERFSVVVPVDTARELLRPYTLFTNGTITGQRDTHFAAVARTPGFANDSLPEVVPAGRYDYLIEQDAEWWCFEPRHNDGAALGISALRLDAGGSVQLPQGTRLLVCSGEAMVSGQPISAATATVVTSASATLTAKSGAVFGLLFDRSRDA